MITFNLKKILFGALIGLFAVVAVISLSHKANAQSASPNMHGYAWSSTIGWVSLNCAEGSAGGASVCSTSNYGVNVDAASGNFSGYGWSSNIGWVSFNAADVSACGAVANLTGATVTGWAKVVSGPTTAGANGCISMHGTSPAYGVTFNAATNAFAGYAWGSTNVGWLDFEYATLNVAPVVSGPSSVDLKVSAPSIPISDGPITMIDSSGGPATLTWTQVNTTSCTVAIDPSAVTGTGPGSISMIVPANTTASTVSHVYTVTCTTPSGGHVSDSVTVKVPPSASVTVVVTGSAPSVTFTVNGVTAITLPNSAIPHPTLAWTGTNVTSCTAVADTVAPTETYWYGGTLVGLTGSLVIPVPAGGATSITHIYGIKCTGPGGTVSKTVSVTVSPSVGASPAVTFTVNGVTAISLPNSGLPHPVLAWTGTNVTSCNAVVDTFGAETYWYGSTAIGITGSLVIPVPAGGTTSITHVYGITCTGPGGSVSKTVSVTVLPIVVPPPPLLTFTVNGTTATTLSSFATPSPTLAWSSTNTTSCTAVVDTIAPSETYWYSGTSTGVSGSLIIPVPPGGSSTVTHIYGITCTGTGGSITKTVSVTVPSTSSIWCEVDPYSEFLPVPSGTVHIEGSATVIWHGISFNPSTISTTASGGLTTTLINGTTSGSATPMITASGGGLGVWIDGPAITATQLVTITATPTPGPGIPTSCTPGQIYIVPPTGTVPPGVPLGHRPPWLEF